MTDATAPAEVGPTVHRFTDTDTAYDVTQSEERHHMGIRDGDVLVVESEGVVGVLANNWPIALTAAHGQFHLAAERYNIREMNDGRYAASGDAAERVAAELGLSLLPHHRALVAAPAAEAPADVEDVWEVGHCTTMRGGAVHEVTTGLDGSDGGPVHIFPLCRTGSMTNQGTRYRKVTGELTCRNCISNRERRRAAKARRLAETAAVEAPAVHAAAPVEEAPAFVKGDRVVCADGMTRTVDHMKRYVADEPEYVVMEGGALWIAANCQHAEQDEVAPAVEGERAALLTEIGARLSVGLTWTNAAAFEPLRDGGELVGWTYRTRSGSEVRYGYVAARGLVLEGFRDLRSREDAASELLDHRRAGTDAVDLTPPVGMYLEAVAALSAADLIAALHAFNVDIVKTGFDGPYRRIVTRGPDFLGTIFDAGSDSRRGRYEAWSPYAGTRHNLVGFHATVEEATDAIAHAWPVAAWELAEETGASVSDVLAAADLLAGQEGGIRVHLQIAYATGADQKFYRDAAEIIRRRLTRQQERAAYTNVQVENLRRSKAAALATHESAHQFRPFHRHGEEQPAGWTFRTGFGAGARYGVTTPDGVASVGLYEYATTAERAFLQAEQDAPATAATPAPLDEQQARSIAVKVFPMAKKLEAHRDDDGRLMGYTFQVGTLHGASYGWITASGTCAKALEPYRSVAVTLLPHALRDEELDRR